MVAAAVAGGAGHAVTGPPTTGTTVPFFYGTNQYVEKFFVSPATLLGAATPEFVANVNPGGFLRGVRCEIRSTGGVLGAGTVAADAPFNVLLSATLENIDGSPIIYPAPGYTHYIRNLYCRPWYGDAAKRFDFSNGVNVSASLFFQPEIRHTAGVLANTDARALYRFRFTINASTAVYTVAPTTAATVTVTLYMESWAQPDSRDLRGNPIEELPPGLNIATLARRQILNLAAAGADNTFQLSNMGNEVRAIVFVFRNSTNVRTDLLGASTRWRLDNRSLGVFSDQEVINRMNDFYELLNSGTTVRPTGTYAFPRFYQPGTMKGESWLPTTNATYMIFETATGAGGTGGTVEIITDEVVPVGPVPMELESI